LTPEAIDLGLISQKQQEIFNIKKSIKEKVMEKLGNYSLPVTEWAKKLPNKKFAAVSPQTKTAADLVASHKDIHV
jgi:tRNA U34 5-carboxymethylaminomethyl modifying enzyme MnmG/GidA